MTANGTISMLAGNDSVRIVTNDGSYPCGFMYAVNYNGHSITINGGDGNDLLIGGTGDDAVWGDDPSVCSDSTGADRISGGPGGSDELHGCGGDDVYTNDYSSGSSITIFAEAGEDCVEKPAASTVVLYCTDDTTSSDGAVDIYDTGGAGGWTISCDAGEGDADYGTGNLSCP